MKVIDLELERESGREPIKGIEFEVTMSPYFFPEAIKADYSEESGCLKISLIYIDTEPAVETPTDNDLISLGLGKHSKKLIYVSLKADKYQVDRVKMRILSEVPAVLDRIRIDRPLMQKHYEVVERALKENSDQIAEVVTA